MKPQPDDQPTDPLDPEFPNLPGEAWYRIGCFAIMGAAFAAYGIFRLRMPGVKRAIIITATATLAFGLVGGLAAWNARGSKR